MTYREGILLELKRLDIPEIYFPKVWEKLMPYWFGHFLINKKINDARIYFAAFK